MDETTRINPNGNVIYSKFLNIRNKQKKIEIINDDLANVKDSYDIFVCSAYKNDYVPLPQTVIGKLYDMGVDVGELSKAPEIDCKNFGVWISQDTTSAKFKRICCVELLDYTNELHLSMDFAIDILLKRTFSTLKYAIEQASILGVDTRRIILPILGAGSQGIELSYVIPPLINQITAILNTFDVDEITFFEINKTKAESLRKYLDEALSDESGTDVFISYSSKQSQSAYKIANYLKQYGITFWMAPESIGPSENYLDMIPSALTNTKMVILILTPEAETSNWVAKEVATAIGANKSVIPCQMLDYAISAKFRFLLDGCQIFSCYDKKDYINDLIKIINQKM